MGSLQRSSRPASRFYGRGREGENKMGRIQKEDKIGRGRKGRIGAKWRRPHRVSQRQRHVTLIQRHKPNTAAAAALVSQTARARLSMRPQTLTCDQTDIHLSLIHI